uniref:Si:dkey-85k7.12 n=1 Tax=Pundamilia nyererei TaxID=303518 RepID=A0A3B4H0D8_9CICH
MIVGFFSVSMKRLEATFVVIWLPCQKDKTKKKTSTTDLMTLFYMFCSVFIFTETKLENLLEDLDIKQYYREKLYVGRILEIDEKTITNQTAKCNSDLPWYFLKKLIMVNVKARNTKSVCESDSDDEWQGPDLDFDDLFEIPNTDDMLNPLDIITALFLCSDGLVQQEMALKMSMCQFSVPLLLPNCDTKQCTLMLWAMRDIAKKYRPQSLSESKGFIEDRIVLSELPMISFVRLGECSLSKSEILNKFLSNSQQYHDTFVHRNMECGDSPRRISNGLTEITWYLPCGNTNIDIFSQPVAVANLRGDIASFQTQYSFLCQTSAAVFVFFDYLDSECSLLTNQQHKAQIFLVGNYGRQSFSIDALKKVATTMGLTKNNIIIKTKHKNDADLVKDLRKTITDVVKNSKMKMTIEQMADVAHELGILVDEDSPECQTAKTNAEAITAEIQDIHKYKEDQLPRQGEIWKELTCLEKEEFRLQHIGSRNIEDYKSELQLQKKERRKRQNSYDMSTAMTCFITALSSPGTERFYFLKWMRMNLDNLSRIKLSELREKYKEKCNNKEEIKEIDRQISNSSLGTEHFFREMGQIYEASLSLPQTDPARQMLQHLPKLCAELLLDGFPLELENKSFTDVMEYSPDTGNWYIPGLWNGNPPMAPVNAGYSEAVYELKKHIIQLLGNCESSANDVSDFKEWVTSLWTAVKHENFIFSFRNSLVADAYMRLCTEFNKWQWEFKKEMYTWVTNAETRISNFGTVAAKSESSDMREFLTCLKSEASTVLSRWETKLLENLTKYFKQTEGHVYLVEGYREEFSNSAKSLRKEMERFVFNQLTAAAEIREGMAEIEKIKKNHTKEIENAVCVLIDECKKKKVQMSDEELDKVFHKMWNETLKKLSFSEQKTTDVFTSVYHCLRINLSHRGSRACELLSQKRLQDCGKEPFKFTAEVLYNKWKYKVSKFFNSQDHIMTVQKLADSIIDFCTQFVRERVKRKSNYCEIYIQEILHIIDEKLQNNQDVKTDTEFEVSLKQHICGFAAREFQKMHKDFIQENDPYRCLMKNMERFCDDFKYKAEEFTNKCLKPAVEYFITRCLGPDIIYEMLTCEQFSTRLSFQYSVLLDLISKDDFQNYVSYIDSYEKYVKTRILNQIVERFSTVSTISEFEDQHLQSCIRSINDAINKAQIGMGEDLKTFIEDICKELGDKLVISQDALAVFMILNNDVKEQFAHWLTECVKDMAQDLRKEFKNVNFEIKLQHLHVQPQDELFSRLVGCGKQCPFCKAPCEAGRGGHTEHFASLHRPRGLGGFTWLNTQQLSTDICSSLVVSDQCFRCSDTNHEWHPYKSYKEIYPDWKIPPDVSFEASDYWKFVMTKYNRNFAKEYNKEPAAIPPAWKQITKDQAEKCLKMSFHYQ